MHHFRGVDLRRYIGGLAARPIFRMGLMTNTGWSMSPHCSIRTSGSFAERRQPPNDLAAWLRCLTAPLSRGR
jgi:hypothetical protein